MQVELNDTELDQILEEITGHSVADWGRRAAARELYHRLRELERSGSTDTVVTLLPDPGANQQMIGAGFGRGGEVVKRRWANRA